MNTARVERLISEVRRAREQQEPVTFTEIDGRLALRITRRDGVQLSFVTPDERAAIDGALLEGPASFQLGRVQVTRTEGSRSWDAEDGGVRLSFVDPPEDPPSASTIASWARRYAWIRENEPALLEHAAQHLDTLAQTWATTPRAIRAGLVLQGVTLLGATTRLLLGTGEAFANHSVELLLDASGHVVRASLCG